MALLTPKVFGAFEKHAPGPYLAGNMVLMFTGTTNALSRDQLHTIFK